MSSHAEVRRRGGIAEAARWSLRHANRLGSVLDRFARGSTVSYPGPLFVLGLPRSGTTLAYELIVQAFEVAYFSRLFDYSYGMPNLTVRFCRPFTRDRRPRYQSSYGRIPGLFAPAEHHNFWMRWFPERARLGHYAPAVSLNGDDRRAIQAAVASISAIANRPFVFKDVYLALSLEVLLEAFEHGKILFVTREPVAIAASVYKKRERLGGRNRWWSIRPPLTERVTGKDLAEQVAFQCIRSRQVIEMQSSALEDERLMLVDYADICRAPTDFVAAVAEWLGEEYERRPNPRIPPQFEIRPPVQIPQHALQQLAEHSARFDVDRAEYLRGVTELARNGRTGLPRSNVYGSER